MHYSLSAILLASALGASGLPAAYAAPSHNPTRPLSHRVGYALAVAQRSTYAQAPALMLADSETTATGYGNQDTASPVLPGDNDARPATPSNPVASEEVEAHRPTHPDDLDQADRDMDHPSSMRPDLDRPEVDRPEIQRPEIQRPDIQRPDVERPEINH